MQYKINFSYEFYDTTGKYCCSTWDEGQLKNLLRILKDVNSKTLSELSKQRKVYHFHEVDWKNTTEKRGFPSTEANKLPPFQFSVIGCNNQKARVFGSYYENTFYIVWFDLNHSVDPVLKR